MSSINLINNSILKPISQTHDKTEPCILPNEYSRDICDGTPRKILPHENILQKQTSFINNSRHENLKTLQHQLSKLDLIDGTRLTSLPLAPPPKTRSRSSITSQGIRQESDYSDRKPESTASEDIEEYIDESFEESEYPIVLVEDYMTNTTTSAKEQEPTVIQRKNSLAIFKQKMNSKGEISSLSDISTASTITNETEMYIISDKKRIIPNDTRNKNKLPRNNTKEENLEEIFGKIPGSDFLKYCNLCEKPLYEISSIINNASISLECLEKNPLAKTETRRLYGEFVCWECIEIYEEFFNELYEDELRDNGEENDEEKKRSDADSSRRLLENFQSINLKYNIQIPKLESPLDGTRKRSFSTGLIKKLYNLHGDSNSSSLKETNESEDTKWIKYLQHKLRWRWRINGLIPSSFNSDQN